MALRKKVNDHASDALWMNLLAPKQIPHLTPTDPRTQHVPTMSQKNVIDITQTLTSYQKGKAEHESKFTKDVFKFIKKTNKLKIPRIDSSLHEEAIWSTITLKNHCG